MTNDPTELRAALDKALENLRTWLNLRADLCPDCATVYRAALRSIVEAIRALHGAAGWRIYLEHAPEMEPVRQALSGGELAHLARTYRVLAMPDTGGRKVFLCLLCGTRSADPINITRLYCPNCHVRHQEI